ncbi:hypothetical protein KAR91_35415, partial [Candidatus Pacearchaeota archaeon]|nr:hypothetical protein [Candidatus Pacearchaeota archaeon]
VEDELPDKKYKALTRKNMVGINDFVSRFSNIVSVSGTLLPVNCRLVQKFDDGNTVFLIEEQPQIRTILYDRTLEPEVEKLKAQGRYESSGYTHNQYSNSNMPHRLTLAFPYMVYFVMLNRKLSLNTLMVFFRTHPITGLSDYLLKANFMNISTSQKVCLGGVAETETLNYSHGVAKVLDAFWVNEFNNDYVTNYQKYSNETELDYLTWQHLSNIDPMFIYGSKWMPYEKTVGQVLSLLGDGREDERRQFYMIESLLTKKRPNERLGSTAKTKKQIYTQITEAVSLVHRTISVGDEIVLYGVPYYIYSFNGPNKSYFPTIIELEDKKGNITSKPFTNSLKKRIEESLESLGTLQDVKLGEFKIKSDDILDTTAMNGSQVYRRVNKLRLARDGKHEVSFGEDSSTYYLLDSMTINKVVETDDLKVQGHVVTKGKKFLLATTSSRRMPMVRSRECTFHGFSGNTSGLTSAFKTTDDNDILTVQLSGESEYSVVDPENLVKPEIARIFNFLLTNHDPTRHFYMVKGRGYYGLPTPGNAMHRVEVFNRRYLLANVFTSENQEAIHIPGYDYDIDFAIGDGVVVADWDTPVEMLIIRKIEGFIASNNWISILMSDSKGQQKLEPYINLDTGKVRIGRIRKIETTWENLKYGDKIRANSTGISNFPKKDVNTIIGFFTDGDTENPVTLCSNCCTLYARGILENFDIIERSYPIWNRLNNTPIDVSKIKTQSGDMAVIKGNIEGGELIVLFGYGARRHRFGRVIPLDYLQAVRINPTYGIDHMERANIKYMENYQKYGFGMPRNTAASYQHKTPRRCFPNMVGSFITSPCNFFHKE